MNARPPVDQIIAYEEGELDFDDVVALFQGLLDSGSIQYLQGSYQRTAQQLLKEGFIHYGAKPVTS